MLKFRLLLDKDKETEWLNSMAQDGWAMTGFFGGFYIFDPCEKGSYLYQVDFTDRFFSVSNDYREFMQEMGAEIVANWGFWIILRKPASEGRFELYSDVDSQIEHYTKIRKLFKFAAILEVICLSIELLVAAGGAFFGYVFALIVAPFAFALANAVFKTNDIIEELKERKTGIASGKKGRRFSSLILVGLLLNSFALMIENPIPIYFMYLKHCFQILALIFMGAGVFTTIHRRTR